MFSKVEPAAVSPQPQVTEQPTQPQSTTVGVGNKVLDFLKGLVSPVTRFGQGLGEAAATTSADTQAQQQSQQAVLQGIQKLQAKAAEEQKKGNELIECKGSRKNHEK